MWGDPYFAESKHHGGRGGGEIDFGSEFPTPATLGNRRYKIIYADPPWTYERDLSQKSAGGITYNKMTMDQLKALPVRQIADPQGCVLCMWATFPKLPEALELMNSYGFHYSTVLFTWIKTRGRFLYSGLGFFSKSNAEIVLIGRRGKAPEVVDKTVKQLVIEPVRVHSQKPDVVRKLITDMFGPDVPKIELFGRFVRPGDPSGLPPSLWTEGWDVWGDGEFGEHTAGHNALPGDSYNEQVQNDMWNQVAAQGGFNPPLTEDEVEFLQTEDPQPHFIPSDFMYNPALSSQGRARPARRRSRSFDEQDLFY